jgi:DNA-directed RNA polymerase specialized sigma24 family protein
VTPAFLHLASSRNRHFITGTRSAEHSVAMTCDEERRLLRRWRRRGDASALARLTRAQRPFIEAWAAAFARSGAALDDLLQEGFVGLLIAIGRFDLRRRNRLAEYAAHWVRMCMARFARAARAHQPISSLDDPRVRRALCELADPTLPLDERLGLRESLARAPATPTLTVDALFGGRRRRLPAAWAA